MPIQILSLALFALNTETRRNSRSLGPHIVTWNSNTLDMNNATPPPCLFLSHLIQLYPGMVHSESQMLLHSQVSVMHTMSGFSMSHNTRSSSILGHKLLALKYIMCRCFSGRSPHTTIYNNYVTSTCKPVCIYLSGLQTLLSFGFYIVFGYHKQQFGV